MAAGVSFSLLAALEATALELLPMQIQESAGAFQVTNNSSRLIRVLVNVYPARELGDGRTTAALTPLPVSEVDRLIRLRPSSFRLGANARRIVQYKLLASSTESEFFVCAKTTAALGEIRICSRWRPSS